MRLLWRIESKDYKKRERVPLEQKSNWLVAFKGIYALCAIQRDADDLVLA